MLAAGVFGTVGGDIASHTLGGGTASLALVSLLAGVMIWSYGRASSIIAIYWLTIAVARTAGIAIGDWMAESQMLGLGLQLATVLTTATFIGMVFIWHPPRS